MNKNIEEMEIIIQNINKYDILISITPYYAYLIMKGDKTVEVRKFHITDPRWSGNVKAYVTKDRKSLKRMPEADRVEFEKYMGKVAFGFDKGGVMCEEALHMRHGLKDSCLTHEELDNYGKGKPLYGYRVTALKIYDKPRELGEFYRCSDGKCQSYNCKSKYCGIVIECGNLEQLTRPPQNYIKIMEV